VERLQLVARAVARGHRVGKVSKLTNEELATLGASRDSGTQVRLEPILKAVERLEAGDAERLLSLQLATLGPKQFAGAVALPLLQEVGRRWRNRQLALSAEHLTSSILRSLLGVSLRPSPESSRIPAILFTTPPAEHHELGLLAAAVFAMAAGGHVVYLGAGLPSREVARAAVMLKAAAVAISTVRISVREAEAYLSELRNALPNEIEIWLGGGRAGELSLPLGAVWLENLDALERKVALLGERV
jgi:methanogenic corrinoid protein MtbC1